MTSFILCAIIQNERHWLYELKRYLIEAIVTRMTVAVSSNSELAAILEAIVIVAKILIANSAQCLSSFSDKR